MCGPVTNDNKHYPLDNQPLQPQLGQIFFLVSVKYFLVLILIGGWWCPQLMFMYCQCYRQSPWRWSWIMTPVSPWSPENCCHHTPALLSWLLIFRHWNAELRCQYLLRPVCPRSVSGRDCPMVTSVSPAPWLELCWYQTSMIHSRVWSIELLHNYYSYKCCITQNERGEDVGLQYFAWLNIFPLPASIFGLCKCIYQKCSLSVWTV